MEVLAVFTAASGGVHAPTPAEWRTTSVRPQRPPPWVARRHRRNSTQEPCSQTTHHHSQPRTAAQTRPARAQVGFPTLKSGLELDRLSETELWLPDRPAVGDGVGGSWL